MIKQNIYVPEITFTDLALIVNKATYLSERLENKVDWVVQSEKSLDSKSTSAEERLNRWCQVVAQGNWEKFRRRLQWDDLDLDKVKLVLSDRPFSPEQNLPQWAKTLKLMMQTALEINQSGETEQLFDDEWLYISHLSCLKADQPIPFEEILRPFLILARRRLVKLLGDKTLLLKLLSENAYQSLEHSLLNRLVNIAAKTLYHEFSHSRPLGHNLFNQLFGAVGTTSEEYYRPFVQKLLQDGLLSFFQTYPVLGRLMATAVDFWVESIAEFLNHLKTDLSDLEKTFTNVSTTKKQSYSSGLGRVNNIQHSISDPHCRGRSVIICKFESGLKLVYKPRNLSIEIAYNQLLDWFNQQGELLPLKILQVLNCQDHGWVEYVEQKPCSNEAAAVRFYQRAGILLGLVYCLGGNDFHHENLIANGEHLVLVDIETLIHPEANLLDSSLEDLEIDSEINQQFWDSVLRTGLLPRWQFDRKNNIAYDISGLGSIDSEKIPWHRFHWQSINTDDMHLTSETINRPTRSNIPLLNGEVISPHSYLSEIVSGFEQFYRFLMRHRGILLSQQSPLMKLKSQQLRFLFRPTQTYADILEQSLAPEFLRDGVDRSIQLDLLSRGFLTVENKPKAWSILHAETKAMEQLDIPYFSVEAWRDDLDVGRGQLISQYFQQSSFDRLISQLQHLNNADLTYQVGIIQGAFRARIARSFPSAPDNSQSSESIDLQDNAPLIAEQLLEEAKAIAQEIQTQTIWESNGNANWISLGYEPRTERFQLKPLDFNLYDGKCGIALFLAALDYLTGQDRYRELILGVLQSFRQFLHTVSPEASQRFVRDAGLGGGVGVGSIIYSFVKIGQFLDEPALLEDAQQLVKWISPASIAAERKLDVIFGSAGAILSLLPLYQATGNSEILERAVACGQHLVENRVSVEGEPKTWLGIANKPLTGFSHGAAGIAYALLKLYQVTQDRAVLSAALEGIEFERHQLASGSSEWIDFRLISQDYIPGFGLRWCHGAPGIALARLGGLPILDTAAIRQEIDSALQASLDLKRGSIDHLCCGELGLVDILLTAAQKLDRPNLRMQAERKASYLVKQAQQRGSYQLFANLPDDIFQPTFFQGTAGIGYTLLRLVQDDLPSVLMWE